MKQQYTFPAGFEWGAATAAYQIEGAVREDGRGESIWDRFSHTPGRIADGTTGDDACDFYHRYEQDIQLAKQIGLRVFRLSVAWPRIFPEGTGQANQKGIDFYRRVLGSLRENGIKSAVTIYHWDLPQKLQDRGGWANRESVEWFVAYAKTLYRELGDLVDYWITLNEPYCTCFQGYWQGGHAPGYRDYSLALLTAHHILMAHGAAVKAYRETTLAAEIGISLNMNMFYPYHADNPADSKAARLAQLEVNGLFGDPVMTGSYPQELLRHLEGEGVMLPEVCPGDMELIHQKLDFMGLNTYFPEHIQAAEHNWPLYGATQKTGRPLTDMVWEVDASTMTDLLKWINARYQPEKLIITENGVACNDWVDVDGQVADPNRVDYFRRYLAAVHDAIEAGVPVKGYYVWSFCDNFEWGFGLGRRFGIVYVDYKTQKRMPKKSCEWISQLIRNNGF